MLGRTSGRFLWCWLSFHFWSSFCYCSSFVNVLHSHFLFDIITFRGLSLGFYTHLILSVQPIAEWFATLSFSAILLSSYRERYGFEWAFFTHRRFLPYAPSQNFWHNLLSSRPPWEPAVLPRSLQNLIWCSKHRPSPSVCLINSNPQSFVQPRFVLIHVNIAKTFTCGENFNENIIFFRFSSW